MINNSDFQLFQVCHFKIVTVHPHLSKHSLIRTLIDAHRACAMTHVVNYMASPQLRYKEIDHECMVDRLIESPSASCAASW